MANYDSVLYSLNQDISPAPVKYQGLADHYGFESSKTNPASPHENGDVESFNNIFKKAVDQSLIIRGSRDFDI